MGCLEPVPLFYVANKTVKEQAFNALHTREAEPEYSLETLVGSFPQYRGSCQKLQYVKAGNTWSKLPPQTMCAALAHIEFYLDKFIGVFQGGPPEQTQITRHLFWSIDKFFRPKKPQYRAREGPISMNKLAKVDARWRTTKKVIG